MPRGVYIRTKFAHWKGGRRIENDGYIEIYQPNHPFARNSIYVLEHRLIIEMVLNRFLKPEERIHHINNIRTDNRIKNLIVFKNAGYHCAFHRYGYLNPNGIVFNGETYGCG